MRDAFCQACGAAHDWNQCEPGALMSARHSNINEFNTSSAHHNLQVRTWKYARPIPPQEAVSTKRSASSASGCTSASIAAIDA
ncbi:MAG: hypothetical protein MHM6MM_003606 [Cercozoa sp. M6MM]